ncbi:MAG TPA: histidine phosphatase family protein [Steroidobacteraceae bacterium]|nr:histidine phosphatase family protein [Steroidobacteraceae bacterium]
MRSGPSTLWRAVALAGIGAAAAAAYAQSLAGPSLVAALRHGGYVLVMRHASSPAERPPAALLDPDNVHGERQLDESGRRGAESMGQALGTLRIEFGMVLSSPAFRAVQSARLAAGTDPAPVEQLNEALPGSGRSRAAELRSEWLRHQVAVSPPAGTNSLIVTHLPNIVSAFGAQAAGVSEGETLVFRPDGNGAVSLVARVRIGEWPRLAATVSAPAVPR